MIRLNRLYLEERALWEADDAAEGFRWVDCGCENTGVFGYLRRPKGDKPEGELLVLLNFTDESAEISLTYDGFMGKLIDTGFGQEKMKHTSGKEKIIPKQLPAFSGWIGKSRIDK